MKSARTGFLTLAASLLCTATVHAQINKCVDASGKTVYSQAPCPANAKSSSIRPAPPGPAVAPGTTAASDSKGDAKPASKGAGAAPKGPMTTAEMERDFLKRRAEQEDAAKKEQEKRAEAKDKEENCRAARAQLVGLESGVRQSRINEKGERVFLDEQQSAAELDRARKAAQAWCK